MKPILIFQVNKSAPMLKRETLDELQLQLTKQIVAGVVVLPTWIDLVTVITEEDELDG